MLDFSLELFMNLLHLVWIFYKLNHCPFNCRGTGVCVRLKQFQKQFVDSNLLVTPFGNVLFPSLMGKGTSVVMV